ncbi:hypothetical protein [Flammeovirga pacifica]|uniref:Lipoprotein n=1 Tax=Flammeovirga pacifica TaxID=915059 RepID=A0A1S1Z438_FLAPC|nr:hypothetical protein [Flammeovirga pacifica]OHX67992.1 hypothetical protein NH26_17400 [Flammeovirga pacifica]
MQTLIKRLCLLIAANFLLFSCASSYHPIAPQSVHYQSSNKLDDYKLKYRYNVLKNNRYKKKEDRKNIHLAAIEFTNNSDHEVVFGNDVYLVSSNGDHIFPVSTQEAFVGLKQSVASYLLYFLLCFVNITVTKTDNYGNVDQSQYPVGLILGPSISIGNMIAAGSANTKFKDELEKYDIMNKTIQPGETRHGIVALLTPDYPALSLKIAETKELK